MKVEPMERIMVRLDRCVGCRSCELACRTAHSRSGQLTEAIREFPPPRRRIFVAKVKERAMPFLCRHCDDPPCVRSCPTGALDRDETKGLVLYEAARCIGCRACVMACPFGMIEPSSAPEFVVKCDRCVERSEPACVRACPTGALLPEGEFLTVTRRDTSQRLMEAAQAGRSL